jgi:lactate permease
MSRGGVVGKMISPQSIAVAAAAGHLVGRESELFRFTVKHSFILLLFICFIVLAQAYLFSWVIPQYHMLITNAAKITPDFSKGYIYLLILIGVLVALVTIVLTRKKTTNSKIFRLTIIYVVLRRCSSLLTLTTSLIKRIETFLVPCNSYFVV